MDTERFLEKYWQKKPCFLKQGIPRWKSPFSPEELAGLACDPNSHARIIQGKDRDYSVKTGPFEDEDFTSLPENNWTVLVQEVDHWVPEVSALKENFNFIPDWRLDDVMVSSAAPGGSAGPHVDQYDVFLVQGYGKRRWQIEDSPCLDRPIVPHQDLAILQDFNPTSDWVLEPGDILYLPPNYAHYGVAVDPCMTFSIGFRSPSLFEVQSLFSLEGVDDPKNRYRDPPLKPQKFSAEILPEAFAQFNKWIPSTLEKQDHWKQRLAQLFTEPKRDELDRLDVIDLPKKWTHLIRNAGARFAFFREPQSIFLSADGHTYELPRSHDAFVEILTGSSQILYKEVQEWMNYEEITFLLKHLYSTQSVRFE